MKSPFFALARYDLAMQRFVYEAIHGLMRAKDPVLGMIHWQEVENLPTTRITVDSGRTIDQPPIPIEADVEFPIADVIGGDFGSLYATIDSAADQGIAILMPQFFGHIDQVTEATGQTVDAGGQPLSFDHLLDVIEKVDVDFDEAGNPRMPTIIAGPAAAEKLRNLPPPTPEQEARKTRIIEAKRAAYLARKRSRRLS